MNLDRLREKLARVAVKRFSRQRKGVKYLEVADNPDGPWVAVYGDSGEEAATSADEILADNDLRTRIFYIPRQYDAAGVLIFPPQKTDGAEDLFTGFQIRFAGQKAQYAVQTFKSDGNGAVFELTATSYKTNMYGLTK